MKTPLNRLPATRLARMIAAHEVSCEAITHSFVDEVHEHGGDVGRSPGSSRRARSRPRASWIDSTGADRCTDCRSR